MLQQNNFYNCVLFELAHVEFIPEHFDLTTSIADSAAKDVFVQPIITQLIKAESDDVMGYLAPVQAFNRDLIFFALHDNLGSETGENHWSLAIYFRN